MLFASINGFIDWNSSCLWDMKFGQWRKKWREVSTCKEHWQVSFGVSLKLCFLVWSLRGHKPTLIWKIHLFTFILISDSSRPRHIIQNINFKPISERLRECREWRHATFTEQHFVLDCQLFPRLRIHLFEEIQKQMPTFSYITKAQKFIHLMNNNIPICGPMSRYVSKSFQLKNFLLAKPKVND